MSPVQETPNKKVFTQILENLHGLGEVEKVISSKFESEVPLLREIPQYLLELGGKRIRPVLCLLCAQALGLSKPSQPLIDVASGIELIHMATLLHDDIIDKSPTRRHEASPFVKYGLTNTLLSGDFLLVRAFSLCAHLDRYIIDATEQACIELTEGEIMEAPLSERAFTKEESLTISRKKTAALFRLAAGSAAFIATEGDLKIVTQFEAFGENLGIAFQVLDDVLDVISTEEQLGKKAGIDIREKKPSLVNILWLQSQSPLAKKLLGEKAEPTDDEITQALEELRDSAVITTTKEIARQYATTAMEIFSGVERSISKQFEPSSKLAIESLASYILSRMQ